MKEGYYRIDYRGAFGSGCGMLAFDNGEILGIDAPGGIYSGSYRFNQRSGLVDVEVSMAVPAGAWLVTDGQRRERSEMQVIRVAVPSEIEGTEWVIPTPTGQVVVTFRRICRTDANCEATSGADSRNLSIPQMRKHRGRVVARA